MAYSDFKLNVVIQKFGLTVNEASGMFANIPDEECSDLLITILRENVDLAVAINTEKARAEMVAAQLFNEQQGNNIKQIYGVITIGTIWQFLKLESKVISIDLSEYYI